MSSGMGSEADRSAAIREVLRSVFDPELGASVVDLNMVRQVHVIGDHAEISLVLSVPDCPLAEPGHHQRDGACPGRALAATRPDGRLARLGRPRSERRRADTAWVVAGGRA